MEYDEWCGDDRGMVVVSAPNTRTGSCRGYDKGAIQEYLWPLLAAKTKDTYDVQVAVAAPENVLIVAAGGPESRRLGCFCHTCRTRSRSLSGSEMTVRGELSAVEAGTRPSP